MTPKAAFEIVTPDIAKAWLAEHNHGNRPINQKVVEKYARDMANGHWLSDGNSLSFDTNGHLVNGQHRLSAIVKSGSALSMLVVRGTPSESFSTTDTGLLRSTSNILTLSGKVNGNALAALTRGIMALRDRVYFNLSFVNYSTQEVIEAIETVSDIERTVQLMRSDYHMLGKIMPQTAAGLAVMITQKLNPDAADEFWAKTMSGIDLPQGSPIAALRNRCLVENNDKRARTNRQYWLAFVFTAWRSFLRNEYLSKVVIQNPEVAFRDCGGYAVVDSLGLRKRVTFEDKEPRKSIASGKKAIK